MSIPADLKYTESHEWVRTESDGTLTIAVIESVKAASDIYAPVSGEIVGANDALTGTPDQINGTPYESWLFKIKPAADANTDRLIDAGAYGTSIGE